MKPELTGHISNLELHVYLDGETAPQELVGIESHLVSCAGCTERLRELATFFAAIESLPQSAMEHDLTPRVLAAVTSQSAQHGRPVRPVAWGLFTTQSILVVVALALFWQTFVRSRLIATLLASMELTFLESKFWLLAWRDQLEAQSIGLRSAFDNIESWITQPLPVTFSLLNLFLLIIAAGMLWLVGNGLLIRPKNVQFPPSKNSLFHDGRSR